MRDTPKPQSLEKERATWREIRSGDIDDIRTVITLESEQSGGSGPYFPDDTTLQNIRYEGLLLEKGKEAIGRIRLAPPEIRGLLFPEDTLPINFVYLRESEIDEELRSKTIDAIRTYAVKKGFKNVGWIVPDQNMQRITGLDQKNEGGITSVPINSFTRESFAKIGGAPRASSETLN